MSHDLSAGSIQMCGHKVPPTSTSFIFNMHMERPSLSSYTVQLMDMKCILIYADVVTVRKQKERIQQAIQDMRKVQGTQVQA